MSEYERPSFRKEWWEEIREYLEDNPDEGFDSEDVKEFIKFCVNRRMEEHSDSVSKSDIEELEERINFLKDNLEFSENVEDEEK